VWHKSLETHFRSTPLYVLQRDAPPALGLYPKLFKRRQARMKVARQELPGKPERTGTVPAGTAETDCVFNREEHAKKSSVGHQRKILVRLGLTKKEDWSFVPNGTLSPCPH